MNLPTSIRLLLIRLDEGLPLPRYARHGDAGADIATRIDVELPPGKRELVPTGIAVAIPEGYVGLIHPRSGLAARHGLGMVNAPGTIDSGYRGEIFVNLINHDPHKTIRLSRGDLIAQLIIQPIVKADFVEVQELPSSQRGDDGHGSTGGVSMWMGNLEGDNATTRTPRPTGENQ